MQGSLLLKGSFLTQTYINFLRFFNLLREKIRTSCIHLEEDIKLNQSGRFYFSFNETLRFDDRILRRT